MQFRITFHFQKFVLSNYYNNSTMPTGTSTGTGTQLWYYWNLQKWAWVKIAIFELRKLIDLTNYFKK